MIDLQEMVLFAFILSVILYFAFKFESSYYVSYARVSLDMDKLKSCSYMKQPFFPIFESNNIIAITHLKHDFNLHCWPWYLLIQLYWTDISCKRSLQSYSVKWESGWITEY